MSVKGEYVLNCVFCTFDKRVEFLTMGALDKNNEPRETPGTCINSGIIYAYYHMSICIVICIIICAYLHSCTHSRGMKLFTT